MDAVLLSRIQFAFTISYHYLFPPMTIGLSWMILLMEAYTLRRPTLENKNMVRFWVNLFALFFALGVATGFVQVFAFGNNWSTFSKFVGNVFGSLLAAEGVFAFFLEAGFLGIMIFGWGRVRPAFHFISTLLVSLGATLSATWIVMANSWMQTPAGYKIVGEGVWRRVVITDLYSVYFNPSFMTRLGHVLIGCGLMGVFIMVSICAYYLLKKRHAAFSRFGLKLALPAGLVLLLLQLWSADSSARGVAVEQPAKLAAMEGIYKTEPNTPMTMIGWLSTKDQKVIGWKVPSLLSILVYRNFSGKAIEGLDRIKPEDWPTNIPGVFYCYHLMIYAWVAMVLYAAVGLILWWRRRLETARWFLWAAVFSIFFPYLANLCGWFTAELGRQPWIVYGLMRTAEGASRVVLWGEVLGSLIMFVTVYAILGALFVFLLNRKMQHGPSDLEHEHPHYQKGAGV